MSVFDPAPLLPSGVLRIAGLGRTLHETFNTQYGYASNNKGRFAFQSYTGRRADWFGWSLVAEGSDDQHLLVNLFMGAWGGLNGEPAITQAILEVEVSYNPPLGPGLVVVPHLEISVNGQAVTYELLGDGLAKIILVVNKPADVSQVPIRFTYRRDSNAGSTGVYINHIDRYSDIRFFPPNGEWEVLDI